MKHYRKEYDDVSRTPSDKIISRIGSSLGSAADLAGRFRSFYKDVHETLFDFIVKQVWLEQHFLYNGVRRNNRSGNGYGIDWAYSHFMRAMAGINQKTLSVGVIFVSIPTYFKDFFPNFIDHDPFTEPKYFKFPYKNISLDHLAFVYQCHNRLEILDEAERKSMNIKDFINWASNWVSCYNDEIDEQMYRVVRHSYIPYIKKMK